MMTVCTSRRKPRRNSAISPIAARRASFGSSAACTAWNRNSGTRATSTPALNALTRGCSAGVARRLAARGPAFTSAAASTEPASSQPRFGVSSRHDASGPSWRASAGRATRKASTTATMGGRPTSSP